jgi:hypothetical protein
VTGSFSVDAALGGAILVNDGERHVFVASYSRTGAHRWSRALATETYGWGGGIAVSGGALYVAGTAFGSATFDAEGAFERDLDLGGGPLAAAGSSAFVASLGSAGEHRWSRSFGIAHPFLGTSLVLAPDPGGGAVVASAFDGTVDAGGGPIASSGGLDVLVASFAADGSHRWSGACGGPADATPAGITVDGSRRVHVLSRFAGELGCGGTISASDTDVGLATFDAAGGAVRAQRFGGTAWDSGGGLAVDGTGRVMFAGEFETEIAIAGRTLRAPHVGTYVAAVDALGVPQWAHGYPWTSHAPIDPVAIVAGPSASGVAGFVQYSGGFGLGPSYLVAFRLDGT